VPILGRIPVLGWLFSRETEGERKTVLIVTIKPTVRNQLLYNSMLLEAASRPAHMSKELRQMEEAITTENETAVNLDDAAWQRCCDDPDPAVRGLKWGHVQWLLQD
jgi:type II secretory pathway component GspD/PulD (secretin)